MGRCVKDFSDFSKYFVWLCVILSLEYLYRFVSRVASIDIQSAYDAGGIHLISAIGAVIALRGRGLFLFSTSFIKRFVVFLIIVVAFSFSFSRTAIGMLVILIIVSFGVLDSFKRIAIGAVISLFLLTSAWVFLPEYDSQDLGFLAKLGNSFSEISFVDEGDSAEMLKNWRGFEAYNAQLAFDSASILEQILGRGAGSTVDLGLYIGMGEGMFFRYLPLLHNGYYHVLGKYGLLGLIFYVMFLLKLVNAKSFRSSRQSEEGVFVIRLVAGVGCVFVYTSLVVSGIFNKSLLDGVLIFVGAMYGWRSTSSVVGTQNRLQ